uniref:Ovule protein n=1 Tax=Caenorhabditis tropicalis TaxID=1561998 RepID=A0A1I7ULR6_9PELO
MSPESRKKEKAAEECIKKEKRYIYQLSIDPLVPIRSSLPHVLLTVRCSLLLFPLSFIDSSSSLPTVIRHPPPVK